MFGLTAGKTLKRLLAFSGLLLGLSLSATEFTLKVTGPVAELSQMNKGPVIKHRCFKKSTTRISGDLFKNRCLLLEGSRFDLQEVVENHNKILKYLRV